MASAKGDSYHLPLNSLPDSDALQQASFQNSPSSQHSRVDDTPFSVTSQENFSFFLFLRASSFWEI